MGINGKNVRLRGQSILNVNIKRSSVKVKSVFHTHFLIFVMIFTLIDTGIIPAYRQMIFIEANDFKISRNFHAVGENWLI